MGYFKIIWYSQRTEFHCFQTGGVSNYYFKLISGFLDRLVMKIYEITEGIGNLTEILNVQISIH